MDSTLQRRAAILNRFGASGVVAEEILAYNNGLFDRSYLNTVPEYPLPDEPFVSEWEDYARELSSGKSFACLRDRLVQLSFPIQRGISTTTEYAALTRRGVNATTVASGAGLELQQPLDIQILIHPTWAGRIPVIVVSCRADFVALVRAFCARNEPVPVPESMGACIVSGYNNWSRVRKLRDDWQRARNTSTAFRIAGYSKELYQDRFLILSTGYYSAVPPGRVGLPEQYWRTLSLTIRREHECAHYWTRRVLQSMRNYLIDEIIADFCGILTASGRFRADWMLAFFGLHEYPALCKAGRLHNYRGSPPLSEEAFALVQKLTVAAAANLEKFYREHEQVLSGTEAALLSLLTLSRFTLEEIASEEAGSVLSAELASAQNGLPCLLRRGLGLSWAAQEEDGYAQRASAARYLA
jgi:hypothetical protein